MIPKRTEVRQDIFHQSPCFKNDGTVMTTIKIPIPAIPEASGKGVRRFCMKNRTPKSVYAPLTSVGHGSYS